MAQYRGNFIQAVLVTRDVTSFDCQADAFVHIVPALGLGLFGHPGLVCGNFGLGQRIRLSTHVASSSSARCGWPAPTRSTSAYWQVGSRAGRGHEGKQTGPTYATKVLAGPEWLHEIKHDG